MLKAKEFNRIKKHVHVVTRWRSHFAMCFIVWCYWWILIVLNFAWYYFIVIFAYFYFKNCYSVFCTQTTTAPNDAKSITPAQSTLEKRHSRAGWGERDGRVTWEAQRQNVQRKLTLIRGRPWNAGISLSTDRGKKRNAAFAQHQKSASAPDANWRGQHGNDRVQTSAQVVQHHQEWMFPPSSTLSSPWSDTMHMTHAEHTRRQVTVAGRKEKGYTFHAPMKDYLYFWHGVHRLGTSSLNCWWQLQQLSFFLSVSLARAGFIDSLLSY